jgi:hypothetical protein
MEFQVLEKEFILYGRPFPKAATTTSVPRRIRGIANQTVIRLITILCKEKTLVVSTRLTYVGIAVLLWG